MADKAHRITDEMLEQMEKRLSAIYSRASKEIQKTADEYFAKFKKQDEAKRKLLEKGKITEDEYKKWRKGKVMYGKRFTEMKEQCAKQLLNVNKTALAYVNGKLPEVYAINYNALESAVDGVGGYSFTLVDADTVRNLAVTDTSLLPYKEIDPKKDIPWNMKKINAETLQGILQGESMDKIAKRILSVQKMNEEAAIRSARTIVTNAECKGRQDSYQRAKDEGIILRKYWLATYDKRARDWHKEAGNKYNEDNAIEIDEFFVVDGEDMLHPGDSEHGAGGHNIYNCRCSIASKVIGFKKAQVQKAIAEKQKPIPVSDEMAEVFKDYSNGKYDYYCEYSQALVSKSGQELKDAIEYVDKYSGSGWYIQDMGIDEAKRRTREMMDIIDSQPKTQTPLYRIDRWDFDKKEGDIIEWGIHSTSRDDSFVDRVLGGNEEGFLEYAEKLKSRPVVFEIVGEKKHLDISKYSSFEQQESLVFGKFKIKSITEPDLSLSIRKQGFDDAVKDFPESFEFFTSKKGKEMVRFANGKTFTIEQARQRTFYNGTYEDWSVISKYEKEARGLATRPRKVQIEQIFE